MPPRELPLNRLFQVFHGDLAAGNRFRLLRQHPSPAPGDEEYAVLTETAGGYAVAFYHRGQAFEFCGAGALCIAATLAADDQPQTIDHPSHPFDIVRWQDQPWVGLHPATATRSDTAWDFPRQGVALHPLHTPRDLPRFDLIAAYSLSPDADTVVAVSVDHDAATLDFRYFTRFNNKGEDSATGSVFRYLSPLQLAPDTEYRVNQRSPGGAQMRCRRQGDQIWYSGEVLPLNDPDAAPPPASGNA